MGILSRLLYTGLAVFDKYLGDALYAMMVYGILRLLSRAAESAVCAMVVMTAIESFQLTMIPAHMLASERLVTRICARLWVWSSASLSLATLSETNLFSRTLNDIYALRESLVIFCA